MFTALEGTDLTPRSSARGSVDRLNESGRSCVVVEEPPILFRGLIGWNLGLGLDAEQSAWAGQMVRHAGLGELLAEPELAAHQSEARLIVVARALACDAEGVIIEIPQLDDQESTRLMAMIERFGGDKHIEVSRIQSETAEQRSL
jgi:hypothetical protein